MSLIGLNLQLRNLSLPVQRELADINVECGELMLEIFNLYAKETRNKQLEDLRKGSVVKVNITLQTIETRFNFDTLLWTVICKVNMCTAIS